MKQGEKFSLRAFHDFVWKNGQRPISLQRWEISVKRADVPPLFRTSGRYRSNEIAVSNEKEIATAARRLNCVGSQVSNDVKIWRPQRAGRLASSIG